MTIESIDQVTSQDVIDALRLALMSQKDPDEIVRLVRIMLQFAPETDSNGGIDLILLLIAEGSLKVAFVQ